MGSYSMLMDKLRNASTGIVWKIVMVVIAVSFILSGVAGYVYTQVDTSAAKVNGVEISQQSFQQRYNNEYQVLSQQLGAQFAAVSDSPEFLQALRNTALDHLITEELWRQYATDLKLGISDEQVKQAIVNTPALQKDGKFDNTLYQQLLSSNGISSTTYGEYVREALRIQQLEQALSGSDFVVPVQSDDLAKLFFQERKVRLAYLPLSAEIDKQTVSEQEQQGYYEKNKAAFEVPELLKVQYIDLTAAAAEKDVKVTDIEIAQYYQDNKAQYMSQRLSHIQVASEKEAQQIYGDLQKGEDFAELAKLYSMDKISAQKGGDLDWVATGMMPPAFEQAATALSVGEYSQPVKVDNAYHIIKATEVKVRNLEEVKNEIAAKLRTELLTKAFYSLEKQANEKAFENPESLTKVAEILGVPLQESGYFSRKDVPAALNYSNLVSTMFDSDVTQGTINSEAINVGEQHSIIVRVIEHKAAGVKSFDEAKTEISNYLKRQKAENIVLEQAQQRVQSLVESGENATKDLSFGESQVWTYAEHQSPTLNNVIFAMEKPTTKPVYKVTKADNGDVVVIELTAVTEKELTAEQLTQFLGQFTQVRRSEFMNLALAALREKAKIEINEEFMKQEQE